MFFNAAISERLELPGKNREEIVTQSPAPNIAAGGAMQFHMPARLIFGPGEIENIKEVADNFLKAQSPVLVTDKGVAAAGLVEKVLALLPGVRVYDGIEANPKSDTINAIGRELRELKPDLVIGLGGGSSLDAGKALALLAVNDGKIENYEGPGKICG